RATLEELESANLLLHVIDISSPRFKDQIKSVERILADLNLDTIPMIRVLNKKDLLGRETISKLTKTLDGIAISAHNESTLIPLIKKMENRIQPNNWVDI
ncbi:MAG: GTPase HflX, partial [Deltaproteobacteria bacterium]|nr:GTPase HflX [Deltaproteobacteria bacterium]